MEWNHSFVWCALNLFDVPEVLSKLPTQYCVGVQNYFNHDSSLTSLIYIQCQKQTRNDLEMQIKYEPAAHDNDFRHFH